MTGSAAVTLSDITGNNGSGSGSGTAGSATPPGVTVTAFLAAPVVIVSPS